MTDPPPFSPPSATLRGAWHGAVTDPEREFRGEVSESGIGGLRSGQRVTVRYAVSTGRVPNAGEHGTYTLHADDQGFPLMSFTCRAATTTGKRGHDDTEEASWHAVALPQ
ncbi:hypothetical protein SAMN04488058_11527 [Deinococcus reticulitermitis]|uniref:Uncharacterized protein n=1 Tax=Deinococcus reticulitermitis TaxID=856736 RepID=A0A1H7AYI0_9DEIO|nr:hypothetical protein [Deinococcus reticulitermitis]SEJ70649.1 hypothetical protein SAMN04488058_11527 [Deinococcus reticulitermitis]